jgi:hypothetical protein
VKGLSLRPPGRGLKGWENHPSLFRLGVALVGLVFRVYRGDYFVLRHRANEKDPWTEHQDVP